MRNAGAVAVFAVIAGCRWAERECMVWNAAAIEDAAQSVKRTHGDAAAVMDDIAERADLLARYWTAPKPAKLERASAEDEHMKLALHGIVARREARHETVARIARLPMRMAAEAGAWTWRKIRWWVWTFGLLAVTAAAGWAWRQWRHVQSLDGVFVKLMARSKIPKDVKRDITGGTPVQTAYRRMRARGEI